MAFCGTSGLADSKFVSSGNYTDREGVTHPWKISAQHALVWEGVPYVPTGVVFHSRYVTIDQTEENWQADVQSLELLKSRGITDLLLAAGAPISWTFPDAWQKLLDYLDSNGFTYGLDLSDGPTEDVSGFLVRPNRYRLPNISSDGDYSFGATDIVGGVFALCSPRDGSIIRSGKIEVREGRMVASVTTGRGSGYLLLVYPEVDMAGMENSLPDVWSGFDSYRDRLLDFFSTIKPGKGLRLMHNPMTGSFGPEGEFENIVPTSAAFRIEFEAWLASKYHSASNLCVAWGITSRNVRSFEEAARLLPLWYAGKGSPTAFDRLTGVGHPVDVGPSTMWSDILQFRDLSVQKYMNTIADLLKRHVADVPVIYRARSMHRVYANGQQQGGFDGLSASAKGVGENLVLGEPAWALAVAEGTERTMWLTVNSTSPPESSYPSKAALHVDLEFLKEIGMKGVYVAGVQTPRESRDGADLLAALEQLDWLQEYAHVLAEVADFVPTLVKYPAQGNVGARLSRLGEGAWWLPTLQPGEPLSLGSMILGYSIPGGDTYTFWSTDGSIAKITLPLRPGQQPTVTFPLDAANRSAIAPKGLELHLDASPLVVEGLDGDQTFPFELAEQEIKELERAYDALLKADKKSPSTKDALDRAKMVLNNKRTQAAYEMARAELINMQEAIGGYLWIEGEHPLTHNLGGVAAATGASNGRYLEINTKNDAPMLSYGASYQISVPKEDSYDIYLAGSMLGDRSSAVTFSIDDGPWQAPEVGRVGEPYGPSFGWHKLGSASLPKGRHTVSLNIVGRRRSDNAYYFAVDALLITPWSFAPDGVKRPSVNYEPESSLMNSEKPGKQAD